MTPGDCSTPRALLTQTRHGGRKMDYTGLYKNSHSSTGVSNIVFGWAELAPAIDIFFKKINRSFIESS
jgi:hypothetical protein